MKVTTACDKLRIEMTKEERQADNAERRARATRSRRRRRAAAVLSGIKK